MLDCNHFRLFVNCFSQNVQICWVSCLSRQQLEQMFDANWSPCSVYACATAKRLCVSSLTLGVNQQLLVYTMHTPVYVMPLSTYNRNTSVALVSRQRQ